ncbi:hypothetical protein NUSPORA_02745 [Nucleospora cyclopteri]
MSITRTLPYSLIGGRKRITAKNPQLLKLQSFFTKIVNSSTEVPSIVRRIEKRLRSTNRVRQPVKLSKIVKSKEEGKVCVIVAKVLDDESMLTVPKNLQIIALKWSKGVQKKVEAEEGKIFTLDQFMTVTKSVEDLVFIETDPSQRKSTKYFGKAPGEKNSTTVPRGNRKCKGKERIMNVKKEMKYEPSEE